MNYSQYKSKNAKRPMSGSKNRDWIDKPFVFERIDSCSIYKFLIINRLIVFNKYYYWMELNLFTNRVLYHKFLMN